MTEHRYEYTRDGRRVRILCDDVEGDYPIVGVFDGGAVSTWLKNGRFFRHEENRNDLMLPPKTRDVWVTWRRGKQGGEWTERTEAEPVKTLGSTIIAIRKITLAEGEGL